MTAANPFTDPVGVKELYQHPQRLQRRTGSLKAAKVHGPDAAATIAQLAAGTTTATAPTILDIGCGRGSTTQALTRRFTLDGLVALDQSPPLLAATRRRAGAVITTVCADFHALPVRTGTVDLVVAAFCLYHSAQPENAVAEIARCLTVGGCAVFATKSADSYAEIDQLLSASRLDPHAVQRPSLYATFNSANAAPIAATALRIKRTLHQDHAFRFRDFDQLAAYVTTSPKYRLPNHLATNPAALADELRRRVPERALLATSTVTYLIGSKP